MKWVDKLKWPGRENYKNSTRKFLVVDGIVEGYKKEFGNLKMYWINRAGHVVSLLYFFSFEIVFF